MKESDDALHALRDKQLDDQNWGSESLASRLVWELAASEARFRKMVKENVDGIVIVDLEGDLRFMNPAAEKLLQRKQDELVGKRFGLPLVAGETTELEIVPKGGGVRTVEMRASETIWEGEPACIASLRDITEHKEAQVEREALIAELESKNAELEQFTYTVSHDLKSPLITIKGFLGMLEKDLTEGNSERLKSDMIRIANAADKMARLLDELLELSRIGRIVNPSENVPLSELAHEAVELVAGRIAEVSAEVDIAPDLPIVYCDRTRFLEVLRNLIDNAVKFTGNQPEPRVEIGVRRDNDEDVCYVRDNGVGIEPEYKDKVFGLFEKLDQKKEGTGIGLAIVKRIVEVHGGRIWVESGGTGKGSTFCFVLPGNNAADVRGD